MTGSLHNKVCVITGASSGIGRSAALQLTELGWTVLMICRNQRAAEQALLAIQKKHPEAKTDLFIGDLSSQSSIHSISSSICQKYPKIDALIHNAGVISPTRQVTVDDLELTFAVNHAAPFLLTSLLMPSLKNALDAKIIMVTSRAEELGKINFEDLQGEKKYHWMQSYSQSKLANLLFAYELTRREKGNQISVLALHPGLTQSELGRNLTGMWKSLPLVLRPFMQSSEKAASFLTQLIDLPPSSSMRYFIKHKLSRSSPKSYDENLASKLWEVTETITQRKL